MAAGLVGKRKTARSAPDRLWRVNVGGELLHLSEVDGDGLAVVRPLSLVNFQIVRFRIVVEPSRDRECRHPVSRIVFAGQPRQRRDHLQTVQLHAVNDPQRAAPAQRLRTVDRPDVGPHGRLEDPEQPGYFQLCEPYLAPGRAADRDPLPVDRNRPRENALHRRRHYRSAGRAFISRRMVWSSTLA